MPAWIRIALLTIVLAGCGQGDEPPPSTEDLVRAAKRGDAAAVRRAIDAGADVDAQNANRDNALLVSGETLEHARDRGYREIARILEQADAARR